VMPLSVVCLAAAAAAAAGLPLSSNTVGQHGTETST